MSQIFKKDSWNKLPIHEEKMFEILGINADEYTIIGCYGGVSSSNFANYFGKVGTDEVYELFYHYGYKLNDKFGFAKVDEKTQKRVWETINGNNSSAPDFVESWRIVA